MTFIPPEIAAVYAIFEAKSKALKNKKTLADDFASVENVASMDYSFLGAERPN